jgi:4-amino-4-deoxy-L-arabinose transferase-like glycosyltransferase
MIKNKRHFLLLVLIFFLGAFLRLYQLNRLSPGFTPDEAAQGYSAYSILKTQKDEWGQTFPLSLRSFGDFKPPLQTYLMIPSVAVFGLNEFAVRLPNALFSSLAIIGVYLLSFSLFKNPFVSLFSSLLLALSPWHLPLSHGAFEANLTVFFGSFGFYFLKKSFTSPTSSKNQILAALFLGLNLFSYHSAKLLTPLFVFIFYLFYSPYPLISSLKKNLSFFLPFLIFFIVTFSSFFTGGQKRGLDIAIFSPTDHWQALNDQRWWAQHNSSAFLSRLFNNKLTYTAEVFVQNYLSYFSLEFFFTQGAGEGTYGLSPGRGLLFIWELPLLLFGLYYLLKKEKKNKKTVFLLLIFILLSPLPAALTKGNRAANRADLMMPWIQIFSAYSLFRLCQTLFKIDLKKYYLIPLLLIFILAIPFLEDYFIHSPRTIAKDMLYGRCEALLWTQQYESRVDQIIVSRKLSEPQAYVTFCLKLDPRLTQSATPTWLSYEAKNLSFVDQLGEYYLGPYHFKEISLPSDFQPGTVLVGLPSEFVTTTRKPDKIINYPTGGEAIYLYYLPSIDSP